MGGKRTKEQQEAYNRARREATEQKKKAQAFVNDVERDHAKAEAKKAKMKTPVPRTKVEKQVAKAVPKPKHDIAAQVKTLGADSLLPAKKAKPIKRDFALNPKAKPKAGATIKPAAQPMGNKFAAKVEPKPTTLAIPELAATDDGDEAQIKPLPKPAKTTSRSDQPAPLVPTTNSRTYVRNRDGVTGFSRTLNVRSMQTTVVFDEATFNKLRDKALFNRVSMAEQIRQCVKLALDGQSS